MFFAMVSLIVKRNSILISTEICCEHTKHRVSIYLWFILLDKLCTLCSLFSFLIETSGAERVTKICQYWLARFQPAGCMCDTPWLCGTLEVLQLPPLTGNMEVYCFYQHISKIRAAVVEQPGHIDGDCMIHLLWICATNIAPSPAFPLLLTHCPVEYLEYSRHKTKTNNHYLLVGKTHWFHRSPPIFQWGYVLQRIWLSTKVVMTIATINCMWLEWPTSSRLTLVQWLLWKDWIWQ